MTIKRASEPTPKCLAAVPLRRLATLLVVVFTLFALGGVLRLSFSDNPRDLYARDADSAELESVQSMFGSDDRGLAIVVDGAEIVTPEGLQRLGDFVESLGRQQEITEVGSIFDARHAVSLGGRAVPLRVIPYELGVGHELGALRDELIAHPLLAGRLLSDDGRMTVVVCRIGASVLEPAVVADIIDRVRSLAAEAFDGSRLSARVTGPAALRVDTFYRLKRDLAAFCALGGVSIVVVGWLIFRHLQTLLIALLCPAIGVVWTLGVMGWLGQRVDGLNCLLPTLLFAIGFTDVMYLVAAIARRRRAGLPARAAAKQGVEEVWRACLLTSWTTAIGFLALTFTTIGSLQRFGLCAAVGVASVFAAVLLVAPVLSTLPWLGEIKAIKRRSPFSRHAVRIGKLVVAHPAPISVGSLALFTLLAVASQRVPFDMRWSEALSPRGETASAARDLDRVFGGSVPASIVVRWPAGAKNDTILACVRELHEKLLPYTGEPVRIGQPFSLLTVLDGLGPARAEPASLIGLVRRRSPELFGRLVQAADRSLLVTVPLPDVGAKRLLPLFDSIDRGLAEVAADHPGFSARLTGSAVVSARNLTEVLHELVRGLSLAAVLAFAVLWAGFRSLRLALISILPNSMPLFVALFVLLLTGQSIQVTVALTLCLSLGLAADDTIHFITCFRAARNEGRTTRSACLRTYRSIGGAMVVTTTVLVVALATTAVSESPAIRLFGCLSSLTLVAALLGDLIILPSLLTLDAASPERERDRSAVRVRQPAGAIA